MDFENEGGSASDESRCEMSESESDTGVECNDGWEDVSVGNRKPKAYTFTTTVGPQFNFLPDAESMDYFSLFFNDEF
jgi:hypothetical protein